MRKKHTVISNDTIKTLWELYDKNTIESIYLPSNNMCISTQVGCAYGCLFCASGLNGVVRDLSTDEIIEQVKLTANEAINSIGFEKFNGCRISFMGMGEPLSNYDHLISAIQKIQKNNDLKNYCFNKTIHLATVGIVPRIKELVNANLPICLHLSLHAPTQEKRLKIMPIAKSYTIEETVDALSNYCENTGRFGFVNYIMIDGFNDSIDDAKKLSDLLKGKPIIVKLTQMNELGGFWGKHSNQEKIFEFAHYLLQKRLFVQVYKIFGNDIEAGCGQLRSQIINSENKWN